MRLLRAVAAGVLTALALLIIGLAVGIPSRHVRGDPGPRAFPIAAAGIVAAGAGTLLIVDARRSAPAAGPWRQALVTAAETVAYLVFLPVAGFITSTALFLIAASFYLDRPRAIRPLIRALVGVGVPVALWWVFGRLLDVVLPAGVLGF